MSTLTTNRTTQLVRGDSLKAIQTAGLLGRSPFVFTSNDTYGGIGNTLEVSGCAFFGRMPTDTAEDRSAIATGVNLSRLRNNVAALLIASTAMTSCEQATAVELPEVQQPAREIAPHLEPQDVENFLDPLIFHWDEENYIVSEAIRSYVVQFDADH